MLRTDFKYNGHWLSDFQMKMFDTDNEPQWVTRTIERSEQTPAREIPMHFTTRYDDVLKHEFLIIRDPDLYASPYDLRLTDKDIHQLRSWLEYPKKPMELVTTEDDEQIDVCYFGVFTSVQPFSVGKECFGLRLYFTCNAPYGFSPAMAKRYELAAAAANSSTSLSGDYLNNAAQYADMTPAIIRIYPLAKGTTFPAATATHNNVVNIHNSATNEEMMVTLPEGFHKLELSCEHKTAVGIMVSGNTETRTALTLKYAGLTGAPGFFGDLTQVFSATFLRLVPGDNMLTFNNRSSIDLVVEIETRYIIKGGGF